MDSTVLQMSVFNKPSFISSITVVTGGTVLCVMIVHSDSAGKSEVTEQ